MSQQSMRKVERLAASDTHPARTQRSRRVSRAVRSRSKIIRRWKVQDHHAVEGYVERLLLAQRMSTGLSGDCGIPFFPDDSDIWATEQPISLSELDQPRSRS
jgi:hypothetical protein